MAMVVVPPLEELESTALEDIRRPPYSLMAEQAVLGGLMLDNEGWDKVADLISEADFFVKEHRHLFSVINTLVQKDTPFDAVTISERISASEDAARAGKAGTLAYLAKIAHETPSAANIRAYAEIVRQKAIRRALIAAASQMMESAYSAQDEDSRMLLDKAEQVVFEIADQDSNKAGGFVPMSELSTSVYEQIDALGDSDSDLTGLSTGFNEIDKKTSGLQKGDLIIVAGRPGMGKTSFALNIVEQVAMKRKDCAIAVFSMEMSGRQLAMRFYSSLARIALTSLRSGKLGKYEWPRMTAAMKMMQDSRIHIDDSSTLSPVEIRARARRLKREQGSLGLVVIDYLQLMQSSIKAENRTMEITHISRALKAMARELDVPVVALSQLNRNVEQRTDHRPVLSDLRESGAIEQDADLILFLYRKKENLDEDIERNAFSYQVEMEAAKQRNGPTFTTSLTFIGLYTRFRDSISDEIADSEGYPESSDHDYM